MGWLTIIMALLSALPELIELVRTILNLIRGKESMAERRALRRELGKICKKHVKGKEPTYVCATSGKAAKEDLEAFLERLSK